MKINTFIKTVYTTSQIKISCHLEVTIYSYKLCFKVIYKQITTMRILCIIYVCIKKLFKLYIHNTKMYKRN